MTNETKAGLLLIEIFERLINPNANGHLGMGGLFLFCMVTKKNYISGNFLPSKKFRSINSKSDYYIRA
jgi:hypothetical protein